MPSSIFGLDFSLLVEVLEASAAPLGYVKSKYHAARYMHASTSASQPHVEVQKLDHNQRQDTSNSQI